VSRSVIWEGENLHSPAAKLHSLLRATTQAMLSRLLTVSGMGGNPRCDYLGYLRQSAVGINKASSDETEQHTSRIAHL
jgi:hypothetical protein